MTDPRVAKLATVLVHYSLELRPGQQLVQRTTPLAEELALAAYTEAVRAGAHVFAPVGLPGAEEAYYRHASDAQLDYVSPVRRLIAETFRRGPDHRSQRQHRGIEGHGPDAHGAGRPRRGVPGLRLHGGAA